VDSLRARTPCKFDLDQRCDRHRIKLKGSPESSQARNHEIFALNLKI
jgi:hypothetical protein